MNYVKEHITEEQYNKFQKMSRAEFMAFEERSIPESWRCGYGWYGCSLRHDNNEFYIEHVIGESCD